MNQFITTSYYSILWIPGDNALLKNMFFDAEENKINYIVIHGNKLLWNNFTWKHPGQKWRKCHILHCFLRRALQNYPYVSYNRNILCTLNFTACMWMSQVRTDIKYLPGSVYSFNSVIYIWAWKAAYKVKKYTIRNSRKHLMIWIYIK